MSLAIAGSAAFPAAGARSDAGVDPSASRYAIDWAAPAETTRIMPGAMAIGVPAIGGGPAARGGDGGSIAASDARTRESAALAADVYNDVAAPPPGFRVASEADLAALNLRPEQLERAGSSFRARVYATGEGAETRYVVAFRGSSSGEDWINNARQALGAGSESYAKALAIGERLARSDASVTLAGHSLGGGLAAAAAIASGREADTFNAAGLSAATIAAARGISSGNGQAGGDVAVQAWNVPGEILTVLQDGGDRVLGGILLGGPGALLADAPSAYGNRRELPYVRPADVGFFGQFNIVDRHMIDWVLAGAGALR